VKLRPVAVATQFFFLGEDHLMLDLRSHMSNSGMPHARHANTDLWIMLRTRTDLELTGQADSVICSSVVQIYEMHAE
jgi:hypothetical protein